jgi:hypothetical protein
MGAETGINTVPTLSIRAYLYAGIVVILLAFLTWGALHERSVEHAKDVAVATKAVAKVEKKDAVIEATATTEIKHEILVYKQAVSLPPVGDIGVVCHAAGGDAVPASASSDGSGHDQGGPRAGDVFDPSGDLLTKSRSYGAIIRALQAENAALRAEMDAAARAHQ